MAVSRYLVTNDSDLEFNLQKLFHDYVALYVKLHFPDSRNAVSHAARRELILKLQKAVNQYGAAGFEDETVQVGDWPLKTPACHKAAIQLLFLESSRSTNIKSPEIEDAPCRAKIRSKSIR